VETRIKIWYGAQSYASHLRVAAVYKRLLRTRYELVPTIEQANVVILHYEPASYAQMVQQIPCLKSKYLIGYCVWEASHLPSSYVNSISVVDEVWTCSEYCASLFRRHHWNVQYIPHVITRDANSSASDEYFVRHIIGVSQRCTYYLAIARLADKRKNIVTLAKTFSSLKSRMPNARLIVKCSPQDDILVTNDSRIIYLPLDLSDSQLNVLYQIADIYVSAHHSEGWGLTLSDAMLFNKPLIATGYSGNLEFMDTTNSFLLDYEERDIESTDCYGNFTSSMKWAYPDQSQLAAYIAELYGCRETGVAKDKVTRASSAKLRFSPSSVQLRICRRLEEISSLLGFGAPE
jgi:glycosyltransferase involved in cell wall biosynthesis